MFKFTSSAVESISDMNGDQVTVTFNGGRDYTYRAAAPETFVSQLNEVIAAQQSVGGFINKAIRNDQLLNVAA
jgi:hypothetical protein